MARAKDKDPRGGKLLQALMTRSSTGLTRQSSWLSGALITWNERYAPIAKTEFLSHGGAFLEVPQGELKDVGSHNVFAHAILDMIERGQFVTLFKSDGSGEVPDPVTPQDRVLKAIIANNTRLIVIPGRMFYEIERGFAPYILLGASEEDGKLSYYRISIPAIVTGPTISWFREIYRKYSQYVPRPKSGFAEPQAAN